MDNNYAFVFIISVADKEASGAEPPDAGDVFKNVEKQWKIYNFWNIQGNFAIFLIFFNFIVLSAKIRRTI